MKTEEITYSFNDTKMKGTLILPEGEMPHPCIMIAHAWKGNTSFFYTMAEEIVMKLGVAAFVCDYYGVDKPVETDEEAGALMMPLFTDRKELRGRMSAAYGAAIGHPLVDGEKMGGIGFCFGGTAMLEIFKAGLPLKGVTILHGIYGDTLMGNKAILEPMVNGIEGSLLLIQGYKDPFLPEADVLKFQKELDEANIDWQMHIYGQAYHAFTNPDAKDKEGGMIYDSAANQRSWQATANFFNTIL